MKLGDAYKLKSMIGSGMSKDAIIKAFSAAYSADEIGKFFPAEPVKKVTKKKAAKKVEPVAEPAEEPSESFLD